MKTAPFFVTQRVTTAFGDFGKNKAVVRRILAIRADERFGSGWGACADGGEPCPTCGHFPAASIPEVDSAWFKTAEEGDDA